MKRIIPALLFVGLSVATLVASQATGAQAPVTPQPQQPGRGGQPGGGGRGGGGRGPIPTMTLTTMAWADGGVIPAKHSQQGRDVSPPLAWSNVPDTAASFVLIVHDIDTPVGNTGDDMLHWLLWNIPKDARALPEGVAAVSPLADGTRQMSYTGPYYRGPGAPSTGPAHHYVFELYALDTMLDVQPTGQQPAVTRKAVVDAMAGHIRGKGALVGLYKHP